MQLIKINPLETQPAQTTFARSSEMLGRSVFNPAVGAGPLETTLGGDNQIRGIGVESLGDDFLTHRWAIGVGGVDKIDPQFDSATQHPNCRSPVHRLAPNSVSRDAHCSESQPSNTQIICDQEFTGLFGKVPALML